MSRAAVPCIKIPIITASTPLLTENKRNGHFTPCNRLSIELQIHLVFINKWEGFITKVMNGKSAWLIKYVRENSPGTVIGKIVYNPLA